MIVSKISGEHKWMRLILTKINSQKNNFFFILLQK
jgi:hypothetical protein